MSRNNGNENGQWSVLQMKAMMELVRSRIAESSVKQLLGEVRDVFCDEDMNSCYSSRDFGSGQWSVREVKAMIELYKFGITENNIIQLYREVKDAFGDEEISSCYSSQDIEEPYDPGLLQIDQHEMNLPDRSTFFDESSPNSNGESSFNDGSKEMLQYLTPPSSYEMSNVMNGGIGEDYDDDLKAFLLKTEEERISEMRSFIQQHHIRQNVIANMCGVTQGYISKLLRGDGHDMSKRVKNNVYVWYLSCKRDPKRLEQIGDRAMYVQNGDIKWGRRDRFTFRSIHTEILERAFNENPYPDKETKEDLADRCNQAYQDAKMRSISESEKLTPSIVNNWFNNRRKSQKEPKVMENQLQLQVLNNS